MPAAIARTNRKTTLWAFMRSGGSVSLLRLAHRARERGNDLEHVPHDAVVGDLEDRRLLVLVDGDDRLRGAHPGEVLDGARDADGDVQVGAHDAARLADLVAVRPPAVVGHRARCADGGVA